MWQPIRIGNRIVNLAQVTTMEITESFVGVWYATGQSGNLSYEMFEGDEAAALIAYLGKTVPLIYGEEIAWVN